jgi:hypothetical protein
LIRGEDVLPPAKRALLMLEGANPFNMCVTHEFIVFLNRDNFAHVASCPIFWSVKLYVLQTVPYSLASSPMEGV